MLDTANCELDFGQMPTGLSYNETAHQIEGEILTAGVHNFTVTATSDCGEKSVDITITMNDTAHFEADNLTQTLCLGTNITPIVLDTAHCTLDFGSMSNELSYNAAAHQLEGRLTTAGTHEFTITATAGNNCGSKTQNVSITMNDTVKLVALSRADDFSQEFCKGIAMTDLNFYVANSDDVELTDAPAGVTLAAVTAESETEPNYVMSGTPTATGTFNFTITASSEACEASVKTFNGTIIVDTIPAVTITTDATNNTVCAGETITLTATAGYEAYTWNNESEDDVVEEIPDRPHYEVTVTNGEGCSNTAEIEITINALPTVTISEEHNLSTICADSAFHFVVNCATAVEYVWRFDNEDNGATGATLRATDAGTYSVIEPILTCSKTESIGITVYALPTVTLASTPAAIDGIALICDGQTATLTATSETNSFSWEKDRESIEGSGNTLEVTEEGKYTVSVTDNNGCSNTSDTITVYVNPLPNFIFGVVVGETGSQENETNVCRGTEVTLIATQMQDAETYTYTWSTSDYLSTTGNTRTFSNEAPAGTYTISVTATSELTGCSQTLSRTIVVRSLPTITVADAQVCLNGTVALSASGAEEYEWTPIEYFMAPNTITDVVTGYNVTFYGIAAGETEINITGTDEYGCVNETTATVTVLELPTTGLTLANKEICQGASTSWTIENGNYTNYVWASSSEDALTADGATATFTSSTTGTHSVTVTVTDNNNCTNSSSAEVMVHALPTPTLSSDNAVCEGNTITFTTDIANADNGIHDYIWTYPETNAKRKRPPQRLLLQRHEWFRYCECNRRHRHLSVQGRPQWHLRRSNC